MALNPRTFVTLFVLATGIGACGLIANVHDRSLDATGGGPTSSSSGGAGGIGGSGGTTTGGSPACLDDETVSCYEGPTGTLEVGLCQAGEATCQNGAFDGCSGQVIPGLEACDSVDDHDCDGEATCQGHWDMSHSFGNAADQQVRAAVVDSQGRLLIAGIFQGTLDFDGHVITSAGGDDFFLVQFGDDGVARWAVRVGGTTSQPPTGLGLVLDDDDNAYLYGAALGEMEPLMETAVSLDGFIASFDGEGGYRWGRLIGGGGGQQLRGLAVDPVSGDLVVAGWYTDGFVFGSSTHATTTVRRIFLGRLSSSGVHQWSDDYGGSAGQTRAYGVAIAANGDIVLAGDIQTDASLGGPVRPINGTFARTFLARYEADGTYITDLPFGTAGATSARRMALDDQGNVLLAGLLQAGGIVDFGTGAALATQSDFGAFVVRFDASFMAQEARLYEEIENVGALAVDPSGYVALGMRYHGATDLGGGVVPHAGDGDVAILKLTPSLDSLWQHHGGRGGFDDVKGVPMDALGRVWAVGSYTESITLQGGVTLQSAGAGDIFVVRFDP
jgi:hypothetical protein